MALRLHELREPRNPVVVEALSGSVGLAVRIQNRAHAHRLRLAREGGYACSSSARTRSRAAGTGAGVNINGGIGIDAVGALEVWPFRFLGASGYATGGSIRFISRGECVHFPPARAASDLARLTGALRRKCYRRITWRSTSRANCIVLRARTTKNRRDRLALAPQEC